MTQLGHKGDPDFFSKVIPLINKSWVTPRTFSIPEAELLDLILLIKSGNTIYDILYKTGISLTIDNLYFCTDSSTAMLWLRSC